MLLKIFASDPMIQDQLPKLAPDALTLAKCEGEVSIISPSENEDIYHLEVDPTIVIDEQLVIESFIPTPEELAHVVRMVEEGKYAHDHECAHGDCACGHNDDHECCGGGHCGH